MINLMLGDCLNVLKSIPDNSVDSIVTDPPYGINFMNKGWDNQVPGVDVWAECLRVLKPGGHLLAFAGTRTQHRMATRIEDAGFEIRDMIAWVYGSGFPKSMDVSKAIDKAAGAEREVVGNKLTGRANAPRDEGRNHIDCAGGQMVVPVTAPATDEAKQWEGWGTALKPALEPITVARKPFAGTVANNVLKHGTGAINVDGCRVGNEVRFNAPAGNKPNGSCLRMSLTCMPNDADGSTVEGRWPANLIHDGSDEVVELFPVTGKSSGAPRKNKQSESIGTFKTNERITNGVSDNGGSAARFFYCPKASKKDRDDGLDGFELKFSPTMGDGIGAVEHNENSASKKANIHPTVKPTDLMAYLCRLVTPPGGTVLDPFMGSGSTGKAAVREGFNFIGIELSEEYFNIAQARINGEKANG